MYKKMTFILTIIAGGALGIILTEIIDNVWIVSLIAFPSSFALGYMAASIFKREDIYPIVNDTCG